MITVNDEDIVIDYSGSSSEVPWPLNGVHNFTFAYTVYPLKCAIGPGIPNNSGTLRPFKVVAPEGSVLNCRHPSPVGLRHINGIMLHAVLYRAMYDAIPEKIIAPSGSPSAIAVIAGKKKNGEPFVTYLFLAGGMGARAHRDGVDTVAFPATVTNVPIEVVEEGVPLLMERKQYRPDLGGRGRHRGGFGQEVRIRNVSDKPMTVSMLTDRNRCPEGSRRRRRWCSCQCFFGIRQAGATEGPDVPRAGGLLGDPNAGRRRIWRCGRTYRKGN